MNDYAQGWMNGFMAGSRRGSMIAIDMIRVNGFSPQQVEQCLKEYFSSGRAEKDMRKEMEQAITEKATSATQRGQ